MTMRSAIVLCGVLAAAVAVRGGCIGEFQHCPTTGQEFCHDCCGLECTLFQCDDPTVHHCSANQYRCPLSNHCVESADALDTCPGIKGTHLDHTLSIDERLTYLKNAVTMEEAIGQLTNMAPPIERLGIPGYNWLSDDEHGVRGWRTTYFPDGPGLGASFDKKLLHDVGRVVGMEARAEHNYLTETEGLRQFAFNGAGITVYGPNMNLVKDPRWGRSQEVYSEDPRLSSALTIGYVTGIQGEAYNGTKYNPKYWQAGACCKHFVAYDIEGGGSGLLPRDHFDANVTTRSFWEHYAPVFHDCAITARGSHIMASYNSMNGIPTAADPNLLTNLLRTQWEWPGFVVGDYDAYANIFSTHHYVPDMEHAASAGMNAGLDQEGGGTRAIANLSVAIKDGLTTNATVLRAFERLMRVRITLGMFDPPTLNPYYRLGKDDLRTPQSTALNRLAAAKGVVLHTNRQSPKNGMKPILPLKKDMFAGLDNSLFVAGSLANNANNTFGNYACDSGNCSTEVTSILGGLKYSGTGLDKAEVKFIPGCMDTNCVDVSQFDKAAMQARLAKVSVVVLGTLGWDRLDAGPNADPNSYEREGHDRTSIALTANQYVLAEKLAATGTPLICVLIHGGSIQLGSLLRSCTAIVDAWFPGQQGGAGVADVLFGKVNPAGRSPQTFYSSDAELPPLGNMDVYAGKGTTYRYYRGTPDIAFGSGLSYTTFSYSKLALGAQRIGGCDTLKLSVDVTNTGTLDGEEVVQVYVKTSSSAVPTPRIRLADFERVAIRVGETVSVALEVTPKYHCVIEDNGKDGFWAPKIRVDAGTVEVYVGGGQPDVVDVLSANVEVTTAAQLTTEYKCPSGSQN